MTLLDVHVKRFYKPLSGQPVEALKDIHYGRKRREYVPIMEVSRDCGLVATPPCSPPSHAGQSRLRAASSPNRTDTATIKNNQASASAEIRLYVFQDFRPLDTLSVKDNILLPLVPLSPSHYRDDAKAGATC